MMNAATPMPEYADVLLDQDAFVAPDWLSDEDCLNELGQDWCRRAPQAQEEAE